MFNGSYYNPYMFQAARGASSMASTRLGIKGLFKGFNFNNFLTSTGKTLNVINQAIPIFYQVKPIINNARTMLKVAGAIRGSDKAPTRNNYSSQVVSNSNSINSNQNTNYTSSNYSQKNSQVQGNPAFFL